MVTLLPCDIPDASDYGSCRRPDCVRIGKPHRSRTGIKNPTSEAPVIAGWQLM